MATNKKVKIVVGAQDKASKKLGKIRSSLSKVKGSVGKAVGAFLAWKTATAILDKTIGAAARQEEIFKKLETAVELTGVSYENASYKINTFLTEMQETTRYGDTDLAPVLQQITQLTGSLEKGFEGSRIAADLAASGLFDLNTASRYVAQAMSGEVTVLGRYIPELKSSAGLINQNMTATEKWAITKDLLNEKFGGAAQGDLDTYAGQLNQLNNYLGDMGEAIGDKVLPHLTEMAAGWLEFLRIVGLIEDPLRVTADNLDHQKSALAALEEELAIVNTHWMANDELVLMGVRSNKEWIKVTEKLSEQKIKLTGEISNINDAIQSYLNSLREIPEASTAAGEAEEEHAENLSVIVDSTRKITLGLMGEKRKLRLQDIKETEATEKAKALAVQQSTDMMMGHVNKYQDMLINGMLQGQIDLQNIFRNMAGDFLYLFVNEILKSVKLALVVKLISLLKLFDVRANDLMAIQMGKDYARFFQQGVFEGMDFGGLAGGMARGAMPQIGGGAVQIGAASPAAGTTIIIQGNIIGEDESIDNLVLAIENKIANKETATLGADEWLT